MIVHNTETVRTIHRSLLVVLGMVSPGLTEDAADVSKLEMTITARPEDELLAVDVVLHLASCTESCSFYFLKPKTLERVYDVRTGKNLAYDIAPLAAKHGLYSLEVSLGRGKAQRVLGLKYRYDRKSFFGSGINPASNDDLIFGQITRESVFASHLDYYPSTDAPAAKAVIRIVAPRGWVGVTAGELKTRKDLPGDTTLHEYEVSHDSGRLPYPLAVFPYVVAETRYDDRLPVSIYSSAQDAGYAKEKLRVVTKKILPFLEELMGPFPYPSVRIVEVFPERGNTGLAAKGVVMLSRRVWFAAPIRGRYDSEPAGVLVDELAHQWNYYKVMLPNYLAEGVSEYTSALFVERHVGRGSLKRRMAEFRTVYAYQAALLNRLKKAKADGLTVEQAARKCARSVEDIAPLWPYADHGELPITDARVFPSLYFIKGALAIHALREELGDKRFFRGFKRLFAEASKTELTLGDYRRSFESVHAGSLEKFFERWYYGIGLPQ